MSTPRAYYNEFDPKAAAWLRELICGGHLMDGDVDERSIEDVRAGDLVGYTRCHFFAGIGGWDYALRLAGWPADRPVWTGSCPCQPFSAAGRGAGHADARHLWPEFYRLIAECRPATVLGEQVASKLGRLWLAAVRADLEGLEYAVGAADLCAASVGAPHIRQRLFWVADAEHADRRPHNGPGEDGPYWQDRGRQEAHGFVGARGQVCGVADADTAGRREQRERGLLDGERAAPGDDADGCGEVRRLADALPAGRAEGRAESGHRPAAGGGESGGVGDTDQPGPQGRRERGDGPGERPAGASGVAGGLADAHGDGSLDEQQPQNGRQTAAVAERDRAGFWDAIAWLPCRDGTWRPAQPGIHPLVAGLPAGMVRGRDPSAPIHADATPEARIMRLRGYGNAINVQVAQAFVEAFLEAETCADTVAPEVA